MKKILWTLLLFVLCPFVQAQTLDHFNAKIEENTITENNQINASQILIANDVENNSTIDGIDFNIANNIEYTATTEYGALFGNNINFNGRINKDSIIIGNNIKFNKNSILNRDVIIMANNVNLKGKINRDITIYASEVKINDVEIEGNINVIADNLIIESGTIKGVLTYPKDVEKTIDKRAVITAQKESKALKTTEEDTYLNNIVSIGKNFVFLFVIFMVLTLIFPAIFNKIEIKNENYSFDKFLSTFTKGILTLILIPLICIALLFTYIGIPLSIIIFIGYGISIYLAKIFVAYLVGTKMWNKFIKKEKQMLLSGLLGFVILFILFIIPAVGSFVSVITLFIGMGIILSLIRK